uniref:Uncharacterized protein n=1 Tax=Ditylenchus dipsaci TaxID=166011 RepID=A0A915DB46_9BILA
MTCSFFPHSDSYISSPIAATLSLMVLSIRSEGNHADISNLWAYPSTPCHSFGDCADEAKNFDSIQTNVGERVMLQDEDKMREMLKLRCSTYESASARGGCPRSTGTPTRYCL